MNIHITYHGVGVPKFEKKNRDYLSHWYCRQIVGPTKVYHIHDKLSKICPTFSKIGSTSTNFGLGGGYMSI